MLSPLIRPPRLGARSAGMGGSLGLGFAVRRSICLGPGGFGRQFELMAQSVRPQLGQRLVDECRRKSARCAAQTKVALQRPPRAVEESPLLLRVDRVEPKGGVEALHAGHQSVKIRQIEVPQNGREGGMRRGVEPGRREVEDPGHEGCPGGVLLEVAAVGPQSRRYRASRRRVSDVKPLREPGAGRAGDRVGDAVR